MRLPTCLGVRRTPVAAKMWSATNLLRIGNRPSVRVDLLSCGLYRSRPARTHPSALITLYVDGWWRAPAMSAASSGGGHTGSSLPLRLRQHLRESRIVFTAASVPEGAPAAAAGDGERERMDAVDTDERVDADAGEGRRCTMAIARRGAGWCRRQRWPGGLYIREPPMRVGRQVRVCARGREHVHCPGRSRCPSARHGLGPGDDAADRTRFCTGQAREGGPWDGGRGRHLLAEGRNAPVPCSPRPLRITSVRARAASTKSRQIASASGALSVTPASLRPDYVLPGHAFQAGLHRATEGANRARA